MDRTSVIEFINAILVASAGSTPLHELNRSYKDITGDSIQYRELGYESLEDFIRSVPTFTCIQRAGGLFVSPAPDEKTAHITKLIEGQKNQKPKRFRNTSSKYDNDSSFRNFAYRQTYPRSKYPPQSLMTYNSSHANWRSNAKIQSRKNWESNAITESQESWEPNVGIEPRKSRQSNSRIESQENWDSDTKSESQRRQSNGRIKSKGSCGSSAKSESQESLDSNTLIEFIENSQLNARIELQENRRSYARVKSRETGQSNTKIENKSKKPVNAEQFKKQVADRCSSSSRSRSSSTSVPNNIVEDQLGISVTLKDHNRQVLLSERFQRMTCHNNKAISLLTDDEDDGNDVFNTEYVNGYNESDSGKITNKDCTPQAMFARGRELSKSGMLNDIPKQQPVVLLPRYTPIQSLPMLVTNYSSNMNVISPSTPQTSYFQAKCFLH